MKHLLLIDAHSVGYACQNATKLTVGLREVQAIYGVLNRIREWTCKFEQATPLMLWDGMSKWRHELYPGYKAQRAIDPKMAQMRKKFREQKPDIKRGLELLGVRNVYSDSSEADDLAGFFVNEWVDKGHRIILITGDRDWLQLIRPGVSCWLRSPNEKNGGDKWVHPETFLDMTGYKTPIAFLQGKALQGDTSDNLPGCGGIGETGAPEVLAHFGSVTNLLAQAPKVNAAMLESKKPIVIDGLRWKKAWVKFVLNHKDEGDTEGPQDRFKRNLQLMNLLKVQKPADLQVSSSKFDPVGYKAFCEELNFRSMTSNFDLWTQPFNKGNQT